MRVLRAALAGLLLAASASAPAHGVAVGVEPAAFTPPEAGTYALARILAVPDATVRDTDGRARSLRELSRGRLTLLGLVYTRCEDPEGCPLATWAFSAVRGRLRAEPALEARVRMVSLSFDPAHDLPQVMARYARRAGARQPGAEWIFLTADSRRALEPILEGLGQDLRVPTGARRGTTAFSHTLKVFLVDDAGDVREIYSGAWLFPEMIVNDLRTLAMEAPAAR